MFKIGCINNSGSRKIQCQQSGKAHRLLLDRIQSMISTDPIIEELGQEYEMIGTKSLISLVFAECIKTRHLKEVCHDLFSTSFCPEHIRYAHGFLIVNAFIIKLYHIGNICGQKIQDFTKCIKNHTVRINYG